MTRVALLLFLGLFVSCSTRAHRGDESNAPPPPLIEPAADLEPFFMRQNLAITARGRKQQIDVVVQYDGDVVTTVFLDPTNRPYVRMVQRGDQAEIDGPGVSKIPFNLLYVMQEIGLALLLTKLQVASKNGAFELASAAGPVADEWVDGRLRQREVADSRTTMQFDWEPSVACPSSISIVNEARGYELAISTTQCEDSTP